MRSLNTWEISSSIFRLRPGVIKCKYCEFRLANVTEIGLDARQGQCHLPSTSFRTHLIRHKTAEKVVAPGEEVEDSKKALKKFKRIVKEQKKDYAPNEDDDSAPFEILDYKTILKLLKSDIIGSMRVDYQLCEHWDQVVTEAFSQRKFLRSTNLCVNTQACIKQQIGLTAFLNGGFMPSQ